MGDHLVGLVAAGAAVVGEATMEETVVLILGSRRRRIAAVWVTMGLRRRGMGRAGDLGSGRGRWVERRPGIRWGGEAIRLALPLEVGALGEMIRARVVHDRRGFLPRLLVLGLGQRGGDESENRARVFRLHCVDCYVDDTMLIELASRFAERS